MGETGDPVRLSRFKFDSPSTANTRTVGTTMPPGLHGNLIFNHTQASNQPDLALERDPQE